MEMVIPILAGVVGLVHWVCHVKNDSNNIWMQSDASEAEDQVQQLTQNAQTGS